MFKSNAQLDHLCKFLNTVRGTDKVLMFVQYLTKLGLLSTNNPALSKRIANLNTPVSDFRILLRYYGLIPMLQWILYSEENKNKNPTLQLLIRLQNIANVIYYPLEHIYWLASHEIISLDSKTRDKVGIWSCRFWMIAVFLYLIQLKEEFKTRESEIKLLETKLKKDVSDLGKEEVKNKLNVLKNEKKSWVADLIVNAAYLPMTVHWSLEQSPIPEFGIGMFGLVASFGQIYLAWKATA